MATTYALPLLALAQNTVPEQGLTTRDDDADDNQNDNDPSQTTHLLIGHSLTQHLGELEKDLAPLIQHLDAALDLEVLAHRDVERMQVGFGVPEEIGHVQHVGGQVDLDARRVQPAEDLDDVLALHAQPAREREPLRHVLGLEHGRAHALLEEGQLGALRDGVAHGQLDHVVAALERDDVVEQARSRDGRVVLEVQLLGLEVLFELGPRRERESGAAHPGRRGEGEVREDVFFLGFGEVPEDDDAVAEDEHFGEGLG